MANPLYCTFGDVASATDIRAASYDTGRVMRAIDAASRSIENLTGGRHFYPYRATRYYAWPSRSQSGPSWVLRLDECILTLVSLTAGGTSISTDDVFLEPSRTGPPYTRIEIDTSTSAVFAAGDTSQRAIAIDGCWGYTNDVTAASTLAEDLTADETAVDVASSEGIGVGDTVKISSEYMLVTAKQMLDTGVDIATGGGMSAAMSATSLACDTATGIPAVGETVLIGSERMLVVDAAGTTLTVRRAVDGSTLAAHDADASIYAPRTLVVERGALGTAAATHSASDVVSRLVVPALVRDLAVAEAVVELGQESAGYASTMGSAETDRSISMGAVRDLRERVERGYRSYPRWGSAV
jgi:hypothetical protein